MLCISINTTSIVLFSFTYELLILKDGKTHIKIKYDVFIFCQPDLSRALVTLIKWWKVELLYNM